MDRVNLIATTSFKYAGVHLKPGDPFTAPRAHARAFKAIKKATDPIPDDLDRQPVREPAVTSEPVGQTVSTEPFDPHNVTVPIESAGYETADMEAETEPKAAPARRRYRTRQVTPKP